MEHHANIVPWLVAQSAPALRSGGADHENSELDIDALKAAMTPDVSCWQSHVSNACWVWIESVAMICREARQRGIVTVIDGSQALPPLPLMSRRSAAISCALTGHKMFRPTGTGALWARRELLEAMPRSSVVAR